VKGTVIESDIAEAAALFGAVREQLSVDGCSRKFYVKDSGMESTDIGSLQLLVSSEAMTVKRSQELQRVFFGNTTQKCLSLDCSKSDIQKNQSDLMIEKRIDFESASFPSLSLELLDNLLLSESISIGSEDALLGFILKLGPGYRDLLRHIQIGFLSEDGLFLLEEHFEIPPESLWQSAAEWIAHPPPPLLDSQILFRVSGYLRRVPQKAF
jgi:hypothetical protein